MAELKDVAERSGKWLLQHQDGITGGWAEMQGRLVSPLNTAEVLLALLDGQVVVPGDQRVQRAVKFLVSKQCTEGPHQGAWMRDVPGSPGVPDLIRTSFAVEALIKAGRGIEDEVVKNAVAWILTTRNEDKGWGYRHSLPSSLTATCSALMALLEACRAGLETLRLEISAGLGLLISKFRNNDGSFGEPGDLRAVHTIYATLVLQAARGCQLNPYSKEEMQAIAWLREHPDDAQRLVEERILVDPGDGRGNYGFLFMTDSLLIRVLVGSEDQKYRSSKLARDAMLSLSAKMDPDGGFYGNRVFSWATAKALSALSVARTEFSDFPRRRPEFAGRKVGHFILGFAVLLMLAVVYLAATDNLGLLAAGLFMFLMLACLVAYGAIRERTFKELVKPIVKVWKEKQVDA